MSKQETQTATGLEIAVIGMVGRFPGAQNLDEFWENLKNGVESLTFSAIEELEKAGISPEQINDPAYVKTKGGFLEDKEYFDAAFFGYTPVEAEVMDPQYRILHQCAWEALEHAGYNPEAYNGLIGLYAGCTDNFDWQAITVLSGRREMMASLEADSLLHKDYLCTRVSYKLNLRGPAVVLQSACSTSLVAVHMACRALITAECDMALAGGVKISPRENRSYMFEEGMIASPDGHCRAFDAKAKGTVIGDGIGIVVLKRLKHALTDGDTIYAVIKASATNNDGIRKIGYTAPSIEGQSEVIRKALRIARVEPESITCIECHGTGTVLGDPIEIEALTRAFNTDKKGYCRIGSVKTNVGHLDAAAGIASFIKAVLAIKNRLIPPNLHFENPNPKIDFENSPFYVNKELSQWRSEKYPLRAGISSFGVGGTNAHVIIEEAPIAQSAERQAQSAGWEYQLILLSARTKTALQQATDNLADYFKKNPGINLEDAAYTLQVGRKAFNYRKMLVAPGVEEVLKTLAADTDDTSADTPGARDFVVSEPLEKVAFMFSGQGAQYVNMGLELYRTETVFHEEMDRCFEILKPLMDHDIKEILYPFYRSDRSNTSYKSYKSHINRTEIAQPVLFAFEYAMARLLIKWGIKPFAMIGHSIGEYVAACLAGVFSLEDALKIVVLRGKLMQRMPGGAMLSVSLGEKELMGLLDDWLELAVVNGPALCVVSGTNQAIDDLDSQLKEKDIRTRRLHTSHAFHSRMMEPILKEFKEAVASVPLNNPQIPYISNLTGGWITVEEAIDPGYWSRHLRKTVRFADGLAALLKKEEKSILVEVGPGRALTTFARQHPDKKSVQKVINTVRHPGEEIPDNLYLWDKIGQLWLYGKSIDWTRFHEEEKPRRIPLPTYPFQVQRLWIDQDAVQAGVNNFTGSAQVSRKLAPDQRFYIPSWKRSVIATEKTGEEESTVNWLVFSSTGENNKNPGLTTQVLKQLKNQGHTVIEVYLGTAFEKSADNGCAYTVNPAQPGDYQALLAELQALGQVPQKIAHFWNVTAAVEPGESESNDRCLEKGFYSLIYLAQALGNRDITHDMEWTVVSSYMQEVNGDEELVPLKATLLGPVMIIPVEYPYITCRSIDVLYPEPGSWKETVLIRQLAAELMTPSHDTQVAFRGNHRLVRTFEPAALRKPDNLTPRLRQGGVYLVTGGLGGIGGVLARHLAQQVDAKLVLTGRTPIPDRQEWAQWLATHSVQNSVSRKIRLLQELEEQGTQTAVYSVDVTDEQEMQQVVTEAETRFGPINGVLHCAGIPGGGMIQLKTRKVADNVLLPKVMGTLVLDRVLAGRTIDFFVLCSSINSIVSRLGQVDYCAANAFLDTFAAKKTNRDNTFAVSINWDAWLEVGMAVEAAKQWRGAVDVEHPLLEHCIPVDSTQTTYISYFRLDSHWVLNEHMTAERKGLAPGVTYLEMAHAAFQHYTSRTQPLELRNVHFLNLLLVDSGETREVALELEKKENTTRFIIKSRLHPGEDPWQNHAAGEITPLVPGVEEPKKYDIPSLQALCHEETVEMTQEINQESDIGLLIMGPRWLNAKKIHVGKNQGLAVMELAPSYEEDLDYYKLHPALMDMATAFLYSHIIPGSAYIPFSYKRLRVFRPLPGNIFSYSRLIESEDTRKEALKFNITIMDEAGNTCVEIEEFIMLEVSEDILGRINQKEESRAAAPPPATPQELLTDGISPSEGIDAFNRILMGPSSQVVVSTRDLLMEIQLNNQPGGLQSDNESEQESPQGPSYERPELSTPYLAPRNDTELMLANAWQNVIGINQLGINDDFFELGGDSLKAITVTGKIHKSSNIEIPLAEFFNRPTIKKLAQYITDNAAKDQFDAIKPIEKKEYYPLSSAQKRLYILHQMEPDQVGYNLPFEISLEGQVIPEVMQRIEMIFRQLTRRHESFRASFEMVHGQPIQKINPGVELGIEYYDSAVNEPSPMAHKQGLSFVRPFDLSTPPLMRLGIIKINKKEHILAVDMHHIIYDGTSHTIILKEFNSLAAGEELPPLKVRYQDYAEWQTMHKQEQEVKKQEEYWINEFKQEIPVLNLPFDFPRPAVQSYEGNTLQFGLNAEETKALKAFAQAEGITLFMVLFSMYYILLWRLSGQEDIVVGTPAAGRKHPDLQLIVGIFLNTLALRNYPKAEKIYLTFLKQMKARTLAAFDNQDYSFEDLVEVVSIKRDLGRSPLFDAMFLLHTELQLEIMSGTKGLEQESDLRVKVHEHLKQTSQYDLTWIGFEIEDRLYFHVEYCSKLFKEETIQRFINYFRAIVSSVLKNPGVKLSGIEILTGDEKERLLYGFNNTAVDYWKDKTLHELFENQAARTPDSTAAVELWPASGLPTGPAAAKTRRRYISYKDLNEKSNQLARQLRSVGVFPGTTAALMAERTIGMLLGLLAILKAGAAYLPIGPEYPAERIGLMLQHADVDTLLVDTEETPVNLTHTPGLAVINLTERNIYIDNDSTNLPPGSAPSDLAYVIFTSGSTGIPKGVMIENRCVVNFIKGITDVVPFTGYDTILSLTTLGFDIFVLETLLPLTQGSRVVIGSAEEQLNALAAGEVIEKERVTILQVTPSRLQLFISSDEAVQHLERLQFLLVGGEALPLPLLEAVRRHTTGKIYNVYGPTETTVWSTIKDVTGSKPLNIGKPIANTRVYILGRNGQLQPVGVIGEICIAGDGLARGYVNQPQLTAEKFDHDLWDYQDYQDKKRKVEKIRSLEVKKEKKNYTDNSPFTPHHSTTPPLHHSPIYRTGDLGKWLPDGNIVCLGRIDHQVKVRGLRIELEEIENQLKTHENINDAVVIPGGTHENKYLCAYFVSQQECDAAALRGYLSRTLPDYMIPSYFIPLEKIPVTPNGKLDRKALPEPKVPGSAIKTTYMAPGTTNQKRIARVWQEVLQLDKVGIHDNFFQLGGNSMMLIQMHGKLKEAIELDMTVVSMFRYPTIHSLAAYLSKEELIDTASDKEIEESLAVMDETLELWDTGD